MALKTFLVLGIFTLIVMENVKAQSCQPDGNDECSKDEDCCSKYCRKERSNGETETETGVCSSREARATRPPTTSTIATTTKRPVFEGRCSWYGEEGNSSNKIRNEPEMMYTTCGDIFHKNVLAAAQLRGLDIVIKDGNRRLPCGTRVRVTNEDEQDPSSKSIEVIVNDEMSHQTSQILSLTYGAFGKISNPQFRNEIPCSFTIIE